MASYEFEHSIDTTADAAAVWRLWSDVATWPSWDNSVRGVDIDGPFEVGTTGTMHIEGQGPISFRLTEIWPGTGFADETEIPGGVLRFVHHVTAKLGGGNTVTVRVEIDGAPDMAAQFGPMVTADTPESVAALVKLAESARD
jgi:hypothetical protein